MSIVAIVLFFALLLAAALVFERARKGKGSDGDRNIHLTAPRADELGPTQTGKYRVQQMLKNTEDMQDGVDGEDDPLPDPFSSGKIKKQ